MILTYRIGRFTSPAWAPDDMTLPNASPSIRRGTSIQSHWQKLDLKAISKGAETGGQKGVA